MKFLRKTIIFVLLFLLAFYLAFFSPLNIDEGTGGTGWDGFAFILFFIPVFFAMVFFLIRFIYRSLIFK